MQLQWHVQKSKLIQKFSFQPVDLQEPYIALIDMGKIIRRNPYKWSDYVQKVSFVTTMLLISSVLMTPMTQPTPLKMTNKTYEYRVGLDHVPNIYMTHSHLLEHSKLALWHQQQREANNYVDTSHKVQQKLSTLLALTALTCQPKNQCRITVSVSLRQTPFSFLHTLYCLQWARCHRLS